MFETIWNYKAAFVAVVLGLLIGFADISRSMNVPVERITVTLDLPVVYPDLNDIADSTSIHPDQLECLRQNIFFEARNQGDLGMLAVAYVTLNRANGSRWPNTICGVVWQGGTFKSGKRHCKFSWTCDGKPDVPNLNHPVERRAWQRAMDIALAALHREESDPTGGATYYHANYVNPNWNPQVIVKAVQINDHIFYRREDAVSSL